MPARVITRRQSGKPFDIPIYQGAQTTIIKMKDQFGTDQRIAVRLTEKSALKLNTDC